MADKRAVDGQRAFRTRSRDREIRRISREQRAQQSAVRIAQPRPQHSPRAAAEVTSPPPADNDTTWQSILQEIKDSLEAIAINQSSYDDTRTDIGLLRSDHQDIKESVQNIKESCAQTTTNLQLMNTNFNDTLQAMRVPTSDAGVVAGFHLRFDCLNDNLSALRRETADQCTASNLAMAESFTEHQDILTRQDHQLNSLIRGNADLAEGAKNLHSELSDAGKALGLTTVKGLEMITKFSQEQYRR